MADEPIWRLKPTGRYSRPAPRWKLELEGRVRGIAWPNERPITFCGELGHNPDLVIYKGFLDYYCYSYACIQQLQPTIKQFPKDVCKLLTGCTCCEYAFTALCSHVHYRCYYHVCRIHLSPLLIELQCLR